MPVPIIVLTIRRTTDINLSFRSSGMRKNCSSFVDVTSPLSSSLILLSDVNDLRIVFDTEVPASILSSIVAECHVSVSVFKNTPSGSVTGS